MKKLSNTSDKSSAPQQSIYLAPGRKKWLRKLISTQVLFKIAQRFTYVPLHAWSFQFSYKIFFKNSLKTQRFAFVPLKVTVFPTLFYAVLYVSKFTLAYVVF